MKQIIHNDSDFVLFFSRRTFGFFSPILQFLFHSDIGNVVNYWGISSSIINIKETIGIETKNIYHGTWLTSSVLELTLCEHVSKLCLL